VFGEVKQGCLNHKAGGEWTSDTIEKALDEFRSEGYESVAMFPYGYFADNSETDYEARKLLEASGIRMTQYIACINASPDFFRWLASRIVVEIGRLAKQQEYFSSDEGMAQPKQING
jgi:ferrochelatase